MFNEYRVCTHDGEFHADDVFGVAVFQLLAELESKPIEIRRSRKPLDLEWANVLIDVGGKLVDPEPFRNDQICLDHHQPGGAGRRDTGIPYASFGLAWRAVGRRLIENLLKGGRFENITQAVVTRVFDEVDGTLVAAIDAVDNGLWRDRIDSEHGEVPQFSLSQVISEMNRPWNMDRPGGPKFIGGCTFQEAVNFACGVLVKRIFRVSGAIAAEALVEAAYVTRHDPRILVLGAGLPWMKCLLEKLQDKEVLFVVYKGDASTPVYMQAVPKSLDDKTPRLRFPDEWGGLEGRELKEKFGLSGMVFCHRQGFIAGAKTYTDAYDVIRRVLDEDRERTLVGNSLSFCVAGIVDGQVDEKKVKKIRCSFRAPSDLESLKSMVLEPYSKAYWRNRPEQSVALAIRFYEQGRLEFTGGHYCPDIWGDYELRLLKDGPADND